MDGLHHDDTATDNSQDEGDSKFPASRHKFGVNAGMRAIGADKSPSHAQLGGLSGTTYFFYRLINCNSVLCCAVLCIYRSICLSFFTFLLYRFVWCSANLNTGQGLSGHGLLTNNHNHNHNTGNTNYTTTDDESVGHGHSHSPNARNKIRKPRAKLQVNPSPTHSSQQSPQATQHAMGDGALGSAENASNVSNVRNEVHTHSSVNSNVNNAIVQESDGENASVKPKRRDRAVGLKAKSEAHLNTHSNNSNVNNNGGNSAAAPPSGPWDSTLDQWYENNIFKYIYIYIYICFLYLAIYFLVHCCNIVLFVLNLIRLTLLFCCFAFVCTGGRR